MTSPDQRNGHATLDLGTRAAKGRKIERILDLPPSHGRRLLEVGTGAGGIAHYFAAQSRPSFDVDAVDVADQRQVFDGYRFTRVDTTTLPFDHHSFDVVISNHVIEHVGDHAAQLHHLQEIHRVLRPRGRVYLAVPNRWMLVEPHYRVPFLSWLPSSWRTRYLRLTGRGLVYDCEPLRRSEVEELAEAAGFVARNASVRAFRLMIDIEQKRGWALKMLAHIPDRWLRRLERIIPTHIYILESRC